MKENMNNEWKCQINDWMGEFDVVLSEAAYTAICHMLATPAATTSGAAGTIKRYAEFDGEGGGVCPDRDGDYVLHADHVAAVAAAREEGRREVISLMAEEAKATVEAMAKPDALHIARLRAAPVVGEAVTDGDIGRMVSRLRMHASVASGSVAFDLNAAAYSIEQLSATAPHAAKEAGKVDELTGWKIERLWAQHADTAEAGKRRIAFGRAVEQAIRAALARTTNKEMK